MLAVKGVGNAAFGKEQYSDAIAAYNEALSLFGERVGSGAQREEKVKVLSNRAECHLKLFDWRAAERSASEAICLSPSHTKSLLRRARALAELGGADALARATNDIKTLRASGATRPSELAPIIAQIKAGRAQQPQSALRGAFSSGGAGLGSAAPPPPPPSRSAAPSAPPPPPRGGGDPSALLAELGAAGIPTAGITPGMIDGSTPEAAAWSRGLAEAAAYEWMVDCYRMRIDDDYSWGGGTLRGVYDPDNTLGSRVRDFLHFCKLAVARRALPPTWQWAAALRTASGLIPYAFEKSDAQEKYGGENVFKAMMGGRSLRFTGEQIYGTGVQTDADDELSEQMRESVRLATIEHDDDDDYSPIILARNPEFFDDVGGLAPWEALCKCFVDDDDDPSHLNL